MNEDFLHSVYVIRLAVPVATCWFLAVHKFRKLTRVTGASTLRPAIPVSSA
jgi:hypothetical protein